MRLTRAVARKIARETKEVCSKNGLGNQVVVWPDLTISWATSCNDCIGLIHTDGSTTYPLVRFSMPKAVWEVTEIIEGRLDEREAFGG